MLSQGNVYDLVQENSDYPGFGDAAFLFSNNFSESKIRGNLQIRYQTADGYDKFCEELLSITSCETIDWNASKHRLVSSGGDQVYVNKFEVADIDEYLDQVLKAAYEDVLIMEKTEKLLEDLSTGSLSRPSRIIAGLALRHDRKKGDA